MKQSVFALAGAGIELDWVSELAPFAFKFAPTSIVLNVAVVAFVTNDFFKLNQDVFSVVSGLFNS